jgi:hypothetical protein
VLENHPTAGFQVQKNIFYLATISQENLHLFREPIKNSATDGITTEPHLIYSAEISVTGTIPSSAALH